MGTSRPAYNPNPQELHAPPFLLNPYGGEAREVHLTRITGTSVSQLSALYQLLTEIWRFLGHLLELSYVLSIKSTFSFHK